eukprot:gene5763-9584_t
MQKLLLLLLVVLTVVNSVPIRCAEQTINALEFDLEEDIETLSRDPCADHNVCQLNCGIYYPHCKRKAYFNLDGFLTGKPVPGQHHFEEYKAFNMVCMDNAFTYSSESSAMIFRIFNFYIALHIKVHWAALNEILTHPVSEWNHRYNQLFISLRLSPQYFMIATSLQNLGIALRKFKKHCPRTTRSLAQLKRKFKVFEDQYYQKMLRANAFENINDSGIKAYKKLQEMQIYVYSFHHTVLHYRNQRDHFHRLTQTYLQAAQAEKRSSDHYTHIGHIYHNQYYLGIAYQHLLRHNQNIALSNQAHQQEIYWATQLTSAEANFNSWKTAVDQYNSLKTQIMNQVLALYINPRFQDIGGNHCQCADFQRFYAWNNAIHPSFLWTTFGIQQHLVQHRFPGYLAQMKERCRRICH